jgi:hypothetical protein
LDKCSTCGASRFKSANNTSPDVDVVDKEETDAFEEKKKDISH